ncbi:MAG: hypothetical protein HN742_28355 [Lentisphaerae bacterium]|jgi:micrococcal nuclease|nr:hypothetical protein [Lentisphaerota bacterium]MBT4817610.1 hypothetical protein [Lentisphaerota bacterium]MBT5612591.1 hypothetical protein [Lentisphaerota bacterium]MBT7055693.1 hypothetical protein [Lentisphaerota bacterium]MBT7845819.1 hypothetical protein [Lentisphaerota bacterium]
MRIMILLTGVTLASWSQIAPGETLRGRVTSVLSGDTFVLLAGEETSQRVTLSEIETPEDEQLFSEDALRVLQEKILNKTVSVTYTPGKDDREIRGKVMSENRWINRDMVAGGWAWHVRSESDSWELARSEKEARRERRGLWRDPTPTAPWVYREEAKEEAQFRSAWEEDIQKSKSRKRDAASSKTESAKGASVKSRDKSSAKSSAKGGSKKNSSSQAKSKKKGSAKSSAKRGSKKNSSSQAKSKKKGSAKSSAKGSSKKATKPKAKSKKKASGKKGKSKGKSGFSIDKKLR